MGLWLIRLLLCAAAAQASAIGINTPEIVLNKDLHHGRVGGVASESRECSAIGRDILARGGNAVDALVGTTFCVGVVGFYHSGIGGGGFAVVRDASGEYEAVDFREEAPSAASENMYDYKDGWMDSIIGGLAVGTPGEIKGLEYIHSKYGVLPWGSVMQGAIHVAKTGFRASKDLMGHLTRMISAGATFHKDPAWAEILAPNGQLIKEGDTITRKRYAETLRKIAEHGSGIFYEGEIGMSPQLVDFVQQQGGILTLDDMRDYRILNRPIKRTTYRDVNLHTIGAPAGGTVSLQILKIMERFEPEDWDSASLNLSAHRLSEAMRFAAGARARLGDPPFVFDHDVETLEEQMLDPSRIDAIVGRISDDESHPPAYYDPDRLYARESHGTSHITAADHSGMAISLTTTVNLLFGAQIMEPNTGIILNDEMNDFSIPGIPNDFGFAPSPSNFIRPHKRPLSSIAPIIAEHPNGTLLAALGASGGSRIISASAQSLWHILDHNMGATDAIATPRLHDQLIPDTVLLEPEFDDQLRDSLREKGHTVGVLPRRLSAVQGIMRGWDGVFEVAAEPRQANSGGYAL